MTVSPVDARVTDIACTLSDGTTPRSLSFAIDASQFADPVNPDDPPRQQRTQVTMNGAVFVAEPMILPGNRRGFWAENLGDTELLLIIDPDGSAKLSDTSLGAVFVGSCTSTRR